MGVLGLGIIKEQFVIKPKLENHQKSIQSKENLLKEGNILEKTINQDKQKQKQKQKQTKNKNKNKKNKNYNN